jgi:hypothetical protein
MPFINAILFVFALGIVAILALMPFIHELVRVSVSI